MNSRFLRLVPQYLAGALATLSALGCSTPPVTADAGMDAGLRDGSPVDPGLQLGTGQLAWEDLPEGSLIELIHGPQGGYHVFARIRERSLGPDVSIAFRVTDTDGGVTVNDPTDRIHLVEGRGLLRTSDGWETASPLLVILVQVHRPEDIVGHTVHLRAEVLPAGAVDPATVTRAVTITRDN